MARDPDECPHPKDARRTDPETGMVSCGLCGLEIFDQPLRIGSRLVPLAEILRRVAGDHRELEKWVLKFSQEIHRLDAVDSKIRDVRCTWPGCQVPPMLRSHWCPVHKEEHRKENDRERQRRRRGKVQGPLTGNEAQTSKGFYRLEGASPAMTPLPTLIFEFETAKAHVINVEDQILQTVERNGVRHAADLPPRETLGALPGPDQPYRIRVPLLTPINQEVVDRIAAGVPHGVRVRLEP